MKATGIVRNIDHLGRACIPKELRKKLHLCDGDPVEFYVDEDKIILRKYDAAGDVGQLLDNLEKCLHLCDPMVPAKKLRKLLEKVKEMRRILTEV